MINANRLRLWLFFCGALLSLGIFSRAALLSAEPRRVGTSLAPAPRLADPVRTTLGASSGPPAAGERRARYVLLLSEDGMHPALIREQPLPNHERLYKNGSYSFRARTISTASTLPSHASMLSGVDASEHGLRWNNWRPERGYIRTPTVFSLATQEGLSTSGSFGVSASPTADRYRAETAGTRASPSCSGRQTPDLDTAWTLDGKSRG